MKEHVRKEREQRKRRVHPEGEKVAAVSTHVTSGRLHVAVRSPEQKRGRFLRSSWKQLCRARLH